MPALRVRDDRDRELVFLRPPQRIVSLVPSDTDNVKALGRSVIGRTRYCDGDAPAVGGTKDVDIEAVARLEPDLVLANQEENSQKHLEELARLGLPLLVSFPKTVIEGLSHLARLAKILQVDARELLKRGYHVAHAPPAGPLKRVFVPIWMDPLMTVNAHTFISDALRLAGGDNVFADRERRYPLAAEQGQAVPKPAGTRDTRYPRIALEEVRERKPEIVLLPDEPHAFTKEDAKAFEPLQAKIVFCNGRDLCWYGARSVEGIPRLREVLR
ncbi:MAG TPA: helical backbone metal receptor [Myxococcales bacterium]|nr:helical backbone metal receptor [Myxococcales bacterium]